jgi:Flp pilus assembly protein TadB
MRGRPIWSVSVIAGLTCALLAVSWLIQGSIRASAMMLAGALGLIAWAIWLDGHEH